MGSDQLFRLSVWRPARLTSTLNYPSHGVTDKSFLFEPGLLQEEVYVWDPGQNDIFSALDKDLAKQFHEMLSETFNEDSKPEKRSIAQLAKIVTDFGLRLRKSEISWTPSEEVVSQGPCDGENFRVNAPLALLNHLSWLIRVFEHVPGASVTIR
jgi:hypothetical protein